jgi:Tfp pilus assembly protein PilN
MAKNMSFLPEDYLKSRLERRTNIICITLFVVILVGTVGAFLVKKRQLAEAESQHRRARQQIEDAARRIEQLEELKAREAQMMRKAKLTSMLIERVPRSVILAELINNMPTALSLTELELDTRIVRDMTPRPKTAMDRAKDAARARLAADIEEPEIPPTQVTMALSGIAPTDVQVAQFITSLNRHEMFTEVNLLVTESTLVEEQTMRRFRIELVVNQDIDITTVEPTLVKRELKQNPMSGMIQINEDGELVMPTDASTHVSDATGAVE